MITYQDYEHSTKMVRLCERIMEDLKGTSLHFSIKDALDGKLRTPEQIAHENRIKEAGLQTSFFSNSDPLYTRAKRKRDIHQRDLNEFKLL